MFLGGTASALAACQAAPVEDHHGMSVGAAPVGEAVEEERHRGRVDR
jgi:hypothetical protein